MVKRDAFEENIRSLFQGSTPKFLLGDYGKLFKSRIEKKDNQKQYFYHFATAFDRHYNAQRYAYRC